MPPTHSPAETGRDNPPVLLVAIDDDPQCLALIEESLDQEDLDILTTTDPARGLELVARKHPQIVLLDLKLPQRSGLEVLEQIVQLDPGTDVILMTAHQSIETAVEAIQKGACDYLTKPLSLDRLRQMIGRLLEEARNRQHALRLDRQLLQVYEFEGLIGRSPLMLEVFARIRRIAPHFRTVLVTGDTGTGKELVARALHRRSPAASGPFAVCNCSAIVETLFESELFGYVKGAFTGATQDKMGLFEYAQHGTLLLDEIGEMPLASQAKLLRVLQSQEIQRVGSPAVRKVDVRVVAATNRDLRALVAEKRFREDLYYRLSMVQIHLPPLLDRKEDLPLLQRYFVERFAAQYQKPIRGLTRRAQAALARYAWPGNVRELENVIGYASMMVESNAIDAQDLPAVLRDGSAEAGKSFDSPVKDPDPLMSLEELERSHSLRVLASVNGNKARAAEILGISRATLYRLLSDARLKSPQGSEASAPSVTQLSRNLRPVQP
ncbi:MAG: sigma-54-dependent Fis family transcriptional regulator [Acidobacteria bacterium]|nr:sigma-54-dependent Fis family transcriptional regulator [Acidobacteriota bacterium]